MIRCFNDPDRPGMARQEGGDLMHRMRLVAAAVAVAALVTACGGSDESGGGGEGVPYGARSCSSWAGGMDEAERWEAAEELLINAKGLDGAEGDKAPSTSVIKRFSADLSTMCDRGASDDLMAVVADELYASNRVFYSL